MPLIQVKLVNEVFSPEQKRQIITYVTQQLQEDKDPGGLFNLGRYGPVTEGLAIFLGGITVLWYLPDADSVAHASLAEIVFCLTVTIALAQSPGWRRAYVTPADDALLRRVAVARISIVTASAPHRCAKWMAIFGFQWSGMMWPNIHGKSGIARPAFVCRIVAPIRICV